MTEVKDRITSIKCKGKGCNNTRSFYNDYDLCSDCFQKEQEIVCAGIGEIYFSEPIRIGKDIVIAVIGNNDLTYTKRIVVKQG